MLPVHQQLALAVVEAPTAARRLGRKSAVWLGIYLGAAALILGVVATVILRSRGDLLELALDYVVPADWQFAARLAIDKLFAQQEQLVITNAAITASLLVVQLTLFPLKEQVSATLEEEASLVPEPVAEHPLWFQAWEEIKLFLALLAAQGTVFWIGYSDDPVRRTIALVASFGVLFSSVAIDFLSPVLQRHRLRYSQIVKTLAMHPVLVLGFGALFALPAIGATALAGRHPEWGFAAQLGVAFGGQVLGIALAAIGGTVAGAPLVLEARARRRSHLAVRVLAWAALLGLLAWNGHRFGAVGRSLHHKSQLLKCEYAIDWDSVRADLPGALDLALGVKTDKLTIAVGLDVEITNPTSVDVEIERNRLEVRQASQLVAQTQLPTLAVPKGATRTAHLTLPLTVTPSQALRIRELWTTESWTMTLYLEVADGFEFPIYLLTR